MKLYWSAMQIPEIARLSRRERKLVLKAWWGWHAHEHGREQQLFILGAIIAYVAVNELLRDCSKTAALLRTLLSWMVAGVPLAILRCRSLARLAKQADVVIRQTDFR